MGAVEERSEQVMKSGSNLEEEQTSGGMMRIQFVDEPLWEIVFVLFLCLKIPR